MKNMREQLIKQIIMGLKHDKEDAIESFLEGYGIVKRAKTNSAVPDIDHEYEKIVAISGVIREMHEVLSPNFKDAIDENN
jgi:hypothetical protein